MDRSAAAGEHSQTGLRLSPQYNSLLLERKANQTSPDINLCTLSSLCDLTLKTCPHTFMQVSWRAVICSQPLRANADFSTLTIQQGIPISDIEEHSRPADLKKACWLFWIELCGEPFTDAIFRDLQRSA